MEWHSIYLYIIAVLTAIYLFFKWKFSYWKNHNVPTLPASIPYGNLTRNNMNVQSRELMQKTYTTFKGQSPLAGLYLTFNPAAVAIDLDLIKDIFIRDFNTFHDRGVYYNEKDDPLSAHMFALDGEKWRSIRNRLSPTFTSGKMKFMYSTVVKVTERFVDTLNSEVPEKGTELEMKEFLTRFTTDVIGECAFGIECNSLKDPDAEFRKYGKLVFIKPRHYGLIISLIIQFPNVARKLGMKFVRDDVSAFFMGVVRETVEYREKNNIRRNDFMDLLIDMKNGKGEDLGGLSVEEIAAQAFVFFLAGFETSSTTLSYTLYELALNQDLQRKARKEIREILQKHNGQLTYEAMMEMHYIDQIISETLRKYPPVPTLFRRAKEEYKIAGTEITIDKGIRVAVPVYAIHHDPEIYPDPERYDPDRFNPEEIKKRHPMSFLAFGDGPRNCIGLRFGRMESRIGLIYLVRNFEIKRSPKTAVPLVFDQKGSVLASLGGLYLRLEKI